LSGNDRLLLDYQSLAAIFSLPPRQKAIFFLSRNIALRLGSCTSVLHSGRDGRRAFDLRHRSRCSTMTTSLPIHDNGMGLNSFLSMLIDGDVDSIFSQILGVKFSSNTALSNRWSNSWFAVLDGSLP
jgi:hypothetical protein